MLETVQEPWHGKGLFGHFRVAVHNLPANPLHHWAPLAGHVTQGGRSEREEEGGYDPEEWGGCQRGGWGGRRVG